ncbi:MAG: NADH-quinone oxidoreductase subunit NuoE [Candidatus Auribacterota bacterium]|jgi:NADH-quinone oxidoreductase E subunit|nr:NADH-quinone oxidoreductase subunit NuoE [Candidatus Auribacterota bacterium]
MKLESRNNQIAQEVIEIVEKYNFQREKLLQILEELNDSYGYLSEFVMKEVAKNLQLTTTEVYSVATFYSFLNTRPKGKYIIRLCKTISCVLAGKNAVANALRNELGIDFGETTSDGKFSLEFTNCIGMCNQGPAMLINNDVYYHLDPEKAVEIVEKYQ